MHTFIVPVDFSETSFNAARYATLLSTQLPGAQIILYHSCIATDKEAGSDLVYDNATADMNALVASLELLAPDTVFSGIVNDGLLLENIMSLAGSNNALLIVMGITGKNRLEQKLIGSNTTRVALESGLPVLIIPADASFVPVEKVVLALQFREHLLETIPYGKINELLQLLNAKLMVVNVDDGEDEIPAQYVFAGQQAAHIMFDDAGATYHMLRDAAVGNSIADFAQHNDAQIILNIAREHNWFELLFKGSLTRQLAFEARLPILALKAVTS